MPKVRYKGLSGIREFTKADFTRVGVDDQGAIKFQGVNLNNPDAHKGLEETHDVSEAAAKHLLTKEGHTVDGDFLSDFEIVEDDETDADGGTDADEMESYSFGGGGNAEDNDGGEPQ